MKRMVLSLLSLLLTAIMLIPGNPVIADKNASRQETNSPYAVAYLESIKVTDDNIDFETREAMFALNDYYRQDLILMESLCKEYSINVPSITSISLEEKIEALHALMNYYEECDTETQLKIYYFFKRYAVDSNDSVSMEYLAGLKYAYRSKIKSTRSFNDNFSPSQAATWAYNNYNLYSSDFPNCTDLGGDCTNFVSQALYHSGMEMHNNWYCHKKNNTYLRPGDTTELNYSWTLSDPSPWISVSTFTAYWDDHCDDYYAVSKSDYINNHSTYYASPIYRGDVVILCKKTLWWTTPSHAMIITQYDNTNQDFKLAGHTSDRQAYPLLTAIANYAQVRFLCL
jgi:hypothetical protein